jgi:hypothetical protein
MSKNYEVPHCATSSILPPPQIPLRSKYSSQNPVLKHPQSVLFLSVRDQVSHPYKTTGRIMVLYILTFTFLDSRRDDKRVIIQKLRYLDAQGSSLHSQKLETRP